MQVEGSTARARGGKRKRGKLRCVTLTQTLTQSPLIRSEGDSFVPFSSERHRSRSLRHAPP